jgi:hypothetical protein
MLKILIGMTAVAVTAMAISLTTPANAASDSTLSGAAIGAGTGALVAGPIGAVAAVWSAQWSAGRQAAPIGAAGMNWMASGTAAIIAGNGPTTPQSLTRSSPAICRAFSLRSAPRPTTSLLTDRTEECRPSVLHDALDGALTPPRRARLPLPVIDPEVVLEVAERTIGAAMITQR